MPRDEKKNSLVRGAAYRVGAGVGTSATLAAANMYANRKYTYDSKGANPNKLLVVAEGGPTSRGGTGHESTAKAIVQAHEAKHGAGSAEIIYTNEFNRISKSHNWVEDAYKGGQSKVTKTKAINNMKMGIAYPISKLTNRKTLHSEIARINPGRVISTHPVSTKAVHKIGIKPEQVVTDYIGESLFWNTPSAAAQYSPTGAVGKSDIQISSLPIKKEYLKSSERDTSRKVTLRDSQKNVIKEVEIPTNRKMVLAMSGSTGAQLDSVVNEALKSKKDFTLYAVTGKNEELRKKLSEIKDSRLIVQGYETDIDGVLGNADMGILRPHGLSATETAGKGLPFIPVTTSRD